MSALAGVLLGLIVLCTLYVRMPVTGGEDRDQRVGASIVAGVAAGLLTAAYLNGWIA